MESCRGVWYCLEVSAAQLTHTLEKEGTAALLAHRLKMIAARLSPPTWIEAHASSRKFSTMSVALSIAALVANNQGRYHDLDGISWQWLGGAMHISVGGGPCCPGTPSLLGADRMRCVRACGGEPAEPDMLSVVPTRAATRVWRKDRTEVAGHLEEKRDESFSP